MDNSFLTLLAVKSLNNHIKRMFDSNALKKNNDGLTGMHYGIISFVANESKEKDVFQRDIEREFNIRRSTATNILQLMEKKALLSREAVADDGRLRKIVLTHKAITTYEQIKENMNTMASKMSEGIPQEELDTFLLVIEKMTKNISAQLAQA